MKRLRLYDMRMGRLPAAIGFCRADTPQLAQYVNSAQQRLIYAKEAGDEGWWGTWAEIAFQVSKSAPYWTAPRGVARLMGVNVCQRPIPVNNQTLEYLQFGNGRMPKLYRTCSSGVVQGYSRNNVATQVDLTNPPQGIRVVATDPADIEAAKRVLIQGVDSAGATVWTQDGLNEVMGEFIALEDPFASSGYQYNSITGIQKDITSGPVKIYQIDPTSGDDVLLLTMQPSEEVASYRRYYFDNLPITCCESTVSTVTTPQTLTLTGLAKLELIPVLTDTDYCLIQNQEALIEECQSIRYSETDTSDGKRMSANAHQNAIRLLMGELGHYLGIDDPAVVFAPFGAARLENQKIGSMI